MAIYGQQLTIQYIAWDTANNAGKTGDASNHTLRWVKDGASAAPTNSPSEVDSTNAPGVYKITLTSTETSCWVGTLCGKSSSSGVVIMPVTLTFERLPTAAPGQTGGLPIIGSAPLTNLDAAISTRLAAADYTAPDNEGIAAIEAQANKLEFVEQGGRQLVRAYTEVQAQVQIDYGAMADAVWDEALSGHQSAGSTGKTLADIASKTALISSGGVVNVGLPVDPVTKEITLSQGDDYMASDGRALEWASSDWPDLAGATIQFAAKHAVTGHTITAAGTVVASGSGEQTVRVELDAAKTASLTPCVRLYRYDLDAVLANGHRITLAQGLMSVQADI